MTEEKNRSSVHWPPFVLSVPRASRSLRLLVVSNQASKVCISGSVRPESNDEPYLSG